MKHSRNYERMLICSDLHGPYLDPKAWGVFLGVCASRQWDRVICNGDFADFSMLSVHDKKLSMWDGDLPDWSLEEELEQIKREICQPLRKAVGRNTKIQFRLGNHDLRAVRLAQQKPEVLISMLSALKKSRTVQLEDLLDLRQWNIELVKDPITVLHKTFTLIHGIRVSASAPKQNLQRFGAGTSGHSHRVGVHTQIMHGRLQSWTESGCLRTVDNIEYLPHGEKPDWCQAFLELVINKRTGRYFCTPYPIIKYTTHFHGGIYSA